MDNFGDFSINEEDGFNSETASLKVIILFHIKKISGLMCSELTKGYWEERPVKVGGGVSIMRTYKLDTREAFCNAVDFLTWLVYPQSDDDFKKKVTLEALEQEKEITDKIKDRRKVFSEINLMFERTAYFDSKSGYTERSN